MWKGIKVAAEICVDDFSMASIDQLVDVLYCVQCAAVSPIGVLSRLQIGLEMGSRTKTAAISAARSRIAVPLRPLFPVRFGYVHPPHGQWLIGSAFQLLRQFVQPSLSSIRLDVLEGLAVDSAAPPLALQRS